MNQNFKIIKIQRHALDGNLHRDQIWRRLRFEFMDDW